jgi:sulfite exporter TauE/SafE
VNSSLMVVLGLGLVMGMQHATEADHLAAVASLVGPERSLARGLRHGIAWGLGHTLTLLLVAGGVSMLGWVISPALAGRFEQVVGAMLIALGISLAWRLRRERFHFHGHRHDDGAAHFHGHAHGVKSVALRQDQHLHGHRLPARSLLVGMVHGLAGSAALALLVSQAMPSAAWGVVYVLVFGFGSILGMALLSGALAIPMGLTARRMTRLHGVVNGAVACFSIGLGTRLLLAVG